ncbi:MAG: DUF4336 domain-containing protein [Myxococcota bacterium]
MWNPFAVRMAEPTPNTLEPVCDGVWQVCGDLRLSPGFVLPLRMTIARLDDGGLWMHSPIPISGALATQLDALGDVRHIVAPNMLHHLFFAAAAERYPEATTYAAPGLPEKRPDLSFDHVLGALAPKAWANQVEQVVLDGAPKLNEVCFVLREAGCVVFTDMLFNVRTPKGLLTPVILSMAGTKRRLAQSRLLQSMVEDREAAGRSMQSLVALPFAHATMCHGDPVLDDAHAAVTSALSWMLDAAPTPASAA